MLQAEARAAADESARSAKKLRHAGNKAFQRGRVEEAVRLYSEARLSVCSHTLCQPCVAVQTPPFCCSISTQKFLGRHSTVCLLLGPYVPAPRQSLRSCHAMCTSTLSASVR